MSSISSAVHSPDARAPATGSTSSDPSPLAAAGAPAASKARSYASASKSSFDPPIVSGSTGPPNPPAAVGGTQQGALSASQHVDSSSVSPVSGKNPNPPPALPSNGGPTGGGSGGNPVMNGATSHAEHSRKSSLTISAAGTSGYMPNGGGPVSGPPSRPNSIQFGSVHAAGSPASTQNVPNLHPHSPSVPAAGPDPRISSPQSSPSPIPTPAASGGRPPSALHGQTSSMSFGSLGSDSGDPNRYMRPGIPGMPPGGPQTSHLRRESSHSAHSDLSNQGMGGAPVPAQFRGAYGPQGGRGRPYGQQYNPHHQMGFQPGPGFRAGGGQSRGGPGMPPQFQGQGGPMGGYPNSPHRGARSPALNHAVPTTPQMQQAQMSGAPMHNPQMGGAFPHQMGHQQGGYGMPPQYDQNYGHYSPYVHQQQMFMGGQQGSPRTSYQPLHPGNQQQHYMQGQYAPPQPQAMSRTSSTVSEHRPSSSVGQASTPSMTPASTHSHQPSQGKASPAQNHSFTKPRTSAGIVIRDPKSGAVKTFDKSSPSPAPPQPASPAIASTPTPPPRPDSQHSRSESKSLKTDEQKRRETLDAVAKKVEADKIEKKRQGDDAAKKEQEDKDVIEQTKKDAAQRKREENDKALKEAEAEAERLEDERARKEEEAAKKKEAEQAAAKAKEEEDTLVQEAAKSKEAEAEKKKEQEAQDDARPEDKAEPSAANAAPSTPSGLAAGVAKVSLEGDNSTPGSDDSMGPPPKPGTNSAKRDKPAALNLAPLKTNTVEPPQPSAALQALRSSRFLNKLGEVSYPEKIASPNPALNESANTGRFKYDRDFLLQFKSVFTEKPSLDWDSKLKETVGDNTDSGRPSSARTPSQGSKGAPNRSGYAAMGAFGQSGQKFPPGAGPDQRFPMGNVQRPPMNNPLAGFGRGGPFPVGGPQAMSRTNSSTGLHSQGNPQSPRVNNNRSGRNNSRRSNLDKSSSKTDAQEAKEAKAMPLTTGTEVKPLQASGGGWKPRTVAAAQGGGAPGPTPGGSSHMEPDMVQRKVKSSLNKMTPEKFDKIADQILEIAAQSKDESDGRTLRQVIQLTFEKATDEAHWAQMYAKFCRRMLESMSPEIKDDNVKDKNGNVVAGGGLFRKYLLTRCQEEFERGWKSQLPDKPEGETEEAAMMSEDYYVAVAAKRRGLGLVQFIGELYKLGMLTERIMHECVKKLVDYESVPDEAEVESLAKLLRTIGFNLDHTEKGHALMDVYFQRIQAMIDSPELDSRHKFMLMDVLDLRRKNWAVDAADRGPQTIQEIRDEAARQQAEKEAERIRQQSQRHGGGGRMPMGRGDARSMSGNYGMMANPEPQRATVGMDELRRLSNRSGSKQASQSNMSFGPPSMSMFAASRSSSGRKPLSNLSKGGEDSSASSRTGTPPVSKEKEQTKNANAFSALASLEQSNDQPEPGSPPSTTSSPPVTKARLSAAGGGNAVSNAEERPKSPLAREGETKPKPEGETADS